MRVLSCDICKKKVDDPVTGRNFFFYQNRDICEVCKDALEVTIKNTVRTKQPFAYDWYRKLVMDNVEKSIQKGRV